jgi:hypothetical protein
MKASRLERIGDLVFSSLDLEEQSRLIAGSTTGGPPDPPREDMVPDV